MGAEGNSPDGTQRTQRRKKPKCRREKEVEEGEAVGLEAAMLGRNA